MYAVKRTFAQPMGLCAARRPNRKSLLYVLQRKTMSYKKHTPVAKGLYIAKRACVLLKGLWLCATKWPNLNGSYMLQNSLQPANSAHVLQMGYVLQSNTLVQRKQWAYS